MSILKNIITCQAHQSKVVEHIQKHRGCIVVHQTGTGKTITAVASIQKCFASSLITHAIVITSLSVLDQFQDEVKRWGLTDKTSFFTPEGFHSNYQSIYKKSSKKDKESDTESESDEESENDDDNQEFNSKVKDQKPLEQIDLSSCFIVIDEAHNIRTNIRVSSITKEVVQGCKAYSIIKATSIAKKVLCLTATPIINDPFDIYNLIMMVEGIKPEESISRQSFFDAIENKESFADMFACKFSFFSKFTNEKQDNNMPYRVEEPIVYFTMSSSYYTKYKAIESKHITPDILASLNTNSKSDMFSTLRRRAVNALDGEESPKIKWVIDFLQKQLKENKKTIVFSQWKETGIHLIQSACYKKDIPFAIISGNIKREKRVEAMIKYNSGQAKVLLISRAGCEGLNLKATNNVIILESNWNAAVDEQIIGRAIRHDSHTDCEDKSVHIYRCMMKKPEFSEIEDEIKSVDEELYDIAYSKKNPVNQAFLDQVKKFSIEKYSCACLNTGFKHIDIRPSLLKVNTQRSIIDSCHMLESYITGKKCESKKIDQSYLSRPIIKLNKKK